jgi:6-phosphofructokinase 1
MVLDDVTRAYERYGYAYIVVGEGIVWNDGTPVSGTVVTDRFSNREFGAMGGGGAAFTLHKLISDRLGFRGEFQIPESLAMAAVDRVVPNDRRDARAVGREAVHRAESGATGAMVTLSGENGDQLGTIPLGDVAVRARPMPAHMVGPNYPSEPFLEYARPLVGPVDRYADIAFDWVESDRENTREESES